MATETLDPSTLPLMTSAARPRWRLRITLGQLMGLVAASGALAAFTMEMARPFPGSGVSRAASYGGPAILAALLVLAGLIVGALRRSNLTEMLATIAGAAIALASFGGLRRIGLHPLWLPTFLSLTVALPLWLRRWALERSSDDLADRSWIAAVARVGLNLAMTTAALVLALIPADALEMLMPVPPPSPVVLATSGPLPSPSSIVPAAIVPPMPLPPEVSLPMLTSPLPLPLPSPGDESPALPPPESLPEAPLSSYDDLR